MAPQVAGRLDADYAIVGHLTKVGEIVDLDANLSIDASKLSLQHRFPMADSIILATARAYDCVIWTQDSDFQHIEGVNYFPV